VRHFGLPPRWLADSVEVYLVCRLLGHPISLSEAIAIESFVTVAKAVGIFAPAAIGVQESGSCCCSTCSA
jgi:hypothetical protein